MLLREAARGRQAVTYAGLLRRHLAQEAKKEAAAAAESQNQQLAARLAQLFQNEPEHAAKVVLGSLTAAQRAELLCVLCQESNHLSAQTNKRLHPLRNNCAHVIAARLEGQQLAAQGEQAAAAAAAGAAATGPPSMRALALIAMASGIPFVGFGFLDNVIMITAGEEIDATLGVKFGLSTLAAAGLGNLVADVAGIGFANSIEQAMRKFNWTREPPLSSAQRLMKQTKWAKGVGASVGVMFGCLLGLVPLVVMDKAYR